MEPPGVIRLLRRGVKEGAGGGGGIRATGGGGGVCVCGCACVGGAVISLR